jgi:hypothetical protein
MIIFRFPGSRSSIAVIFVFSCFGAATHGIIIHVGTGIPELTIDQQTNQKVPRYHRHVTDIIQERENDK